MSNGEPLVESQEEVVGDSFNRQRFLERLLVQCQRVKKVAPFDGLRLQVEVGKLLDMLVEYETSCEPPQEI